MSLFNNLFKFMKKLNMKILVISLYLEKLIKFQMKIHLKLILKNKKKY